MNQINNSNDKIRSNKIIFKLRPIDGKGKDSTGLLDKGLFTGNNKLFAMVNPQTMLWSVKYEHGKLPPVLRDQQWTSYQKLLDFVIPYMKNRNVEIVEIID